MEVGLGSFTEGVCCHPLFGLVGVVDFGDEGVFGPRGKWEGGGVWGGDGPSRCQLYESAGSSDAPGLGLEDSGV